MKKLPGGGISGHSSAIRRPRENNTSQNTIALHFIIPVLGLSVKVEIYRTGVFTYRLYKKLFLMYNKLIIFLSVIPERVFL